MSDASSVAVKVFTMTWKIKNFSYLWQSLTSPPVTPSLFNGETFNLLIDQYDNKIRIRIATYNRLFSPLDYEVALLTSDGSPELSKEGPLEFRFNRTWNYQEKVEILVVPTGVIYGEKRRDDFLPHDALTIRCRLLKRKAECSESEEQFIGSSVGVQSKLFIWTLADFISSWTGGSVHLFTIENTYGRLELRLSIKLEERIIIEMHRDKGEKIFSTLKISLLDADGVARRMTSDSFFFEKSETRQTWPLPPLINKSELVASKSQLLPNYVLSLKCEFGASLGTVNDSETITFPKEFISISKYFDDSEFSKRKVNSKLPSGFLQNDLRCILDTGSLSDFKLKVDSEVFPVHKVLLAARSPVFNAMFTNDYKETSSGQVLISDMDADTIRRFLIYLYSDTIDDLTMENATKLYFVADKYGVLCLKEICVSFLKDNLSSSSACSFLILADQHQDDELKAVAQDYISKHNSEILRSEDWQNLEKSNHLLALETLREICLNK
ncbi:Speckle-type POZ protein B like protein [Argiope bruennichi]|uniref:Speckle-type POZ protein B like protein n=1 Tax=Argiope bruennichi TaxID=94029 RepID=A0A8T0EGJ4_ARGBR|nr:Speckle-type POZ protein B like protein [Argiope bruennichi]